jgi:hypothetical protein
VYCDVEQRPQICGSVSTHKYLADQTTWREINADDLIFFADEQSAIFAKYEPRKVTAKKPKSRSQLVAK